MNNLTKSDDPVGAIRAFNRFWTAKIGALGGSHLQSSYSLTEARVLFELSQKPAVEVAELRRGLELDAGYLSRILHRFRTEKLVAVESSEADARKQIARLLARGKEVFGALDAKASEAVSSILTKVTDEDRRRLVAAIGTVRAILEGAPRPGSYLLRPLGPGDLGWVVRRHGILYADEHGYDQNFEALVARIMADYAEHRDPERENAWIAEAGGEPVGSVFCVKKSATVAQLRCLLVEPSVRGMGVGTRLVDECLRFARRAGYKRVILWTHEGLDPARRIYERAGFTLANSEPANAFGHDVVEQTWSLTL
ncbi:GNAT family N-acetyltransferase [Pendulispora albinea]|uniref:Helix-turn-helix domain-containing GNAT family N-acetyltransferase n=1 Tax=Pendulispora albinea TaxID=2741071 RepID=A0ABZ2LS32_9BACT